MSGPLPLLELHGVLGTGTLFYLYSKLPFRLPLPKMLECRKTSLRYGESNFDGDLGRIKT